LSKKSPAREGSLAPEKHKHEAPRRLKIVLITVSSSRYRDPSLGDESGSTALALCKRAGHDALLEIVDDDREMIRLHVLRGLFEESGDAAILIGGTGLAPRDVTIEAISPLLDKKLEGFGEMFRSKSFDSIGSAAFMTRALAGTIANKPIFCLPGSPDAATTGVSLALNELPHAVFIASSKP
jgi:molybdopterin adenylyltransferase